MSQLKICDLNFIEPARQTIAGSGRITPTISTDTQTATATRTTTGRRISGDLENGFDIEVVAVGQAAGAAVGVASVGGKATVRKVVAVNV